MLEGGDGSCPCQGAGNLEIAEYIEVIMPSGQVREIPQLKYF